MNEKNIENNILSNHTISIRIGDNVKFIDLDVFTALCDRFFLDDIIDIVAQSPTHTIIYSGIRNKVKFVLQIYPKLDEECPVS